MTGEEKEGTFTAERFGANLVWLRGQARLSQQALADRVGMKRVAISVLERGCRVPRIDTILKLAAGLDASPGKLIVGIWWDPASQEYYESSPSSR
jgi:transcriptional regulator with XRE-family HTH domain